MTLKDLFYTEESNTATADVVVILLSTLKGKDLSDSADTDDANIINQPQIQGLGRF